MPKQTFFNLPEEKRERILAVAIEEFADNDIAAVSISRIVEKAGIAKGSFYQYFEGKEDLLEHLLDLIVEKKTEMLSLHHPDPQHVGIFAYLQWLVQAGVEFELAYPQLVRFGYRMMGNDAWQNQLPARFRQDALAFYQRLVALGKTQGDIDPEIDEELAAFFFDVVLTNLGQFLFQRADRHRGTGWRGKQPFFEMPEVRQVFEQAVAVLEYGMSVGDGRQK